MARAVRSRLAGGILIAAFLGVFAVAAPVALASPAPQAPATASVAAVPRATDPTPVDLSTAASDAASFLPAWRWDSVDLQGNFGFKAIADNPYSAIMSIIAGFIFLMAWLVWKVIVELLRFGMTADVITKLADTINSGFAAIAKPLNGPIRMLLALPLLAFLVRKAAKIDVTSMVRAVAWFVLPLAALSVMTANSAGSGTAVGSPAWFGTKGVEFTNDVGGLVGTISLPGSDASVWAATPGPSCQAYVQALYDTYAVKAQGGDRLLQGVSQLWERGFASNWYAAQFGEGAGPRVGCVWLDARNNISPTEMQRIAKAAGWGTYGTVGVAPFTGLAGDGNKAFSFVACTYDGGWKPGPGWNLMKDKESGGRLSGAWNAIKGVATLNPSEVIQGGSQALQGSQTFKTPTAGTCKAWFSSDAAGKSALELGNLDVVAASIADADKTADAAQRDDLGAVRDSVEAFTGNNGGDRILRSFIALLTSLLYAWGLGPLAVGGLLAQIGVLLLLMLLPVTLLLLAIPDKQGNRNATAVRLAKLTAGFMASKVVIGFLVNILVITILATDGVMRSWGGWFASLLAPAAAILLFRKLLQQANLGDLMKFSSALTMPAALATASADAKGVQHGLKEGALRRQLGMSGNGKPATSRLGKTMDALDRQTSERVGKQWKQGKELLAGKAKAAGRGAKDVAKNALGLAKDTTPIPALGQGPLAALAAAQSVDEVRALSGTDGLDAQAAVGTETELTAAEIAAEASGNSTQRKALEAVVDPSERSRRLDERTRELDESIRNGYADLAGLPADQLLNRGQQETLQLAAAQRYGLDPGAVLVSDGTYGTAVPDLSPEALARLTDDQLTDIVAHNPWLTWDPAVRERRDNESERDWVRRLNVLANEVGHAQGAAKVDVMGAYGLTAAMVRGHLLGTSEAVAGLVGSPSASLNEQTAQTLRRALSELDGGYDRVAHASSDGALRLQLDRIAQHEYATNVFAATSTALVDQAVKLAGAQRQLDLAVKQADRDRLTVERDKIAAALAAAQQDATNALTRATELATEATAGLVLDAVVGANSYSVEAAHQEAARLTEAIEALAAEKLAKLEQLSTPAMLVQLSDPAAAAGAAAAVQRMAAELVDRTRALEAQAVTARAQRNGKRSSRRALNRARDVVQAGVASLDG